MFCTGGSRIFRRSIDVANRETIVIIYPQASIIGTFRTHAEKELCRALFHPAAQILFIFLHCQVEYAFTVTEQFCALFELG